jgi:hypothetical protein
MSTKEDKVARAAKVPGLVHNVSAAPLPNFLGFRVMLARGTTAGSWGCFIRSASSHDCDQDAQGRGGADQFWIF